jgi:hypothetical protein
VVSRRSRGRTRGSAAKKPSRCRPREAQAAEQGARLLSPVLSGAAASFTSGPAVRGRNLGCAARTSSGSSDTSSSSSSQDCPSALRARGTGGSSGAISAMPAPRIRRRRPNATSSRGHSQTPRPRSSTTTAPRCVSRSKPKRSFARSRRPPWSFGGSAIATSAPSSPSLTATTYPTSTGVERLPDASHWSITTSPSASRGCSSTSSLPPGQP